VPSPREQTGHQIEVPQGLLHINPCAPVDACKEVNPPASCCLQTNFSTSTSVSCGTCRCCRRRRRRRHCWWVGAAKFWSGHPFAQCQPLTNARGPRVGEAFSGLYTTDLADPDLTIGMIQTHGSECGYILEPEQKMQLTIAFECDKDTPDPGVLT
jgi:hypothetical protein